MKKKVLVLAAVAALTVGIFTISTHNKSLAVNQAYGYGVVACIGSYGSFCLIDGEWFFHYYPVSVDKPEKPTES